MNIYEALVAVQAEVGKCGISKDRRNQAQGFNFRGVDDVMNTLNPILSAHGVVVLPEFSDRVMTAGQAKSGGALFNVTVRGTFSFVAKDGSAVKVVTYGEASDSGDKATNKAMAAAYKYAMFQTLCIPTEGDGDTDADQASPEPVKPPAKPAPKSVKQVEAFGLVEDAMAALAPIQDAAGLSEWSARVKVSAGLANWTEEELVRLRAGMAAKTKELKL